MVSILYIYIYNGILFSHRKEKNTATCYNMNKPQNHHAKWKKRDINETFRIANS